MSVALRNLAAVLRLGRHDGGDEAPWLSAVRARRNPGDRAAAGGVRTLGATALAHRAGHACRRLRLASGLARRGAHAAGLHQRAPRRHALCSRRSSAPIGRRAHSARARAVLTAHHHLPRLRERRRHPVGRRQGRARRSASRPGRLSQFVLFAVFAASRPRAIERGCGARSRRPRAPPSSMGELLAVEPDHPGAGLSRCRCPSPPRGGSPSTCGLRLSDPAARRRCSTSMSLCGARRRAHRRSSAPRARARARSSICCCASTIRPRRRASRSTVSCNRADRSAGAALPDRAGAAGRRGTSPRRSPTTSASVGPTQATPRSRRPPSRRRPTISSGACRRATTRMIGERGVTLSRRPAPAHRDRAGDLAGGAAAALDEGDLLARRRERDSWCRPRSSGLMARPHHPGDRASARDRALLRPHPGDGARPHRRAGHPR